MFREGNSLLKVGMIMMALALVVGAVIVSATLRSKPERLVAAEVATNSPGQAQRSSSEEPSATKNSSSEKEVKEPRAVFQQEAEGSNSQSATPQLAGQQTPSEAPSGPEPQPQLQHQPQQQEQPLPGSDGRGWPEPTRRELKIANQERHYELLPGAIMASL